MRTAIALLSTLAIGLSGTAGAGQRAERPTVASAEPAPTVSGKNCTIVQIDSSNVAPIVTVTFGTKGPFRFLLDTGAAGHGRISTAVAASLSLPVIGMARAAGPNGAEERPIYAADGLTLGDMTFAGVRLTAMSASGPNANVDGVLGIGLFQSLVLGIDYGNHAIRLRRGPLEGGLPVTFDRGIPTITVSIAGKSFNVHLDTGNSAGALFLPEIDAKALPLAGPPVTKGKARTTFAEVEISEAPLSAPVSVEGVILSSIKAVRWPPARDIGNLGSPGLVGARFEIDQQAKLVHFGRPGPAPFCRS